MQGYLINIEIILEGAEKAPQAHHQIPQPALMMRLTPHCFFVSGKR